MLGMDAMDCGCRRLIFAACAVACLWARTLPVQADEPVTINLAKEDVFTALLAPAMADGKISAAEHDVIITVARRLLTKPQLEELQKRIAWFESDDVGTETKSQALFPAGLITKTAATQSGTPGQPIVVTPAGEIVGQGAPLLVDPSMARLLENLYVSSMMEGFKSPVDLNRNAFMGWNNAINWGVPLWEEIGLGVQIGAAMNQATSVMSEAKAFNGMDNRQQYYTTAGLFQRTNTGFSWGGVYDLLWDEYYLSMRMSQLRFQAGYSFTPIDEVGAMLTIRSQTDQGTTTFPFFSGTVSWEPVTNGSVYWLRNWDNGATTKSWVGVADAQNDLLFGGSFQFPLSDHVAMVGMGNFLMTPDKGNTSAMTGIAIYPWGGARRTRGSRFAPLMPVGNNSTFMLDRE